jgi:hypothetical protein
MKVMKYLPQLGSLVSILLCGPAALAQNIPIANYSFEDPAQGAGGYNAVIPDWNISGGVAGVWNPLGWGPYTFGAFSSIPDGAQVGYINGYGGTTVSQTLAASLLPNTTYTLSIWIGNRGGGLDPGTDYSVGLYGGANLLASVTPASAPLSDWIDLTATYTTGASVPSELLGISISTPVEQLDFDDVTLTASPAVSAVPDCGNATWIAGLVLMAFSRFVRARE